jgi:hypothetical protein
MTAFRILEVTLQKGDPLASMNYAQRTWFAFDDTAFADLDHTDDVGEEEDCYNHVNIGGVDYITIYRYV